MTTSRSEALRALLATLPEAVLEAPRVTSGSTWRVPMRPQGGGLSLGARSRQLRAKRADDDPLPPCDLDSEY